MAAKHWAIVLAGGEGVRLRALTDDATAGPVPKQFCSLCGGTSLLADALARARVVAPPERTLVVVAAQHRRFWEPELVALPPENVLVQPVGRGTGVGLALPLAVIAERDPRAVVVVLPSDHHVTDEDVFGTVLRDASARVPERGAILLGIEADAAETEYGWILPGPSRSRLKPVESFVEKPPLDLARRLLRAGALWNSFVLAGRVQALLDLQREATPEVVDAFRSLAAREGRPSATALGRLYAELDASDYSRDVLQRSARDLRVLRVQSCGWTDLGTPQRVLECVRREPVPLWEPSVRGPAVVLKERLARLGTTA